MPRKSNKPPFQVEEPLPCPRCDSKSTKFCYYNNHCLSQPRLFCRDCRRHWTLDGALRNVPVGGGTHGYKYSEPCRFSKRIRSLSVTINNDEEEDTNEGNNVISSHGSGDGAASGSGGDS